MPDMVAQKDVRPIRVEPGPWTEEELREMPTQGFQKTLSIVLDEIGPHIIRAHIDIEARHLNSGGLVHGGVLISLADSVGAIGALQNLGPKQRTATLESKTNFLRPCTGTSVVAVCEPLHVGQRTSVWHTVLHDDQKRECAHVWQTQLHIEN